MNSHPGLQIDRHDARTTDGWTLGLKRTVSPSHRRPGTRPVLIVPGYGMNAFIFGFHPRGTSMERCLAEAGFEVWSADLRAQGRSRRARPDAPGPSMLAYAEHDVPALLAGVLAATRTGAKAVDLIGCSLGGTIVYGHLALFPDAPIHAVISIGAPLRWVRVHPALKAAFSSPWLAERLVIRGARPLMRAGSRVLAYVPQLLSIYLNAAHVDVKQLPKMIETVEDPDPRVNVDIARWIATRDLTLRGVNVTEAMRAIDRPLLLVVSNRDGIVPEESNLSATGAWGGADVEVLRVGTDEEWYAHADLFIGNEAPRVVFAPLAEWLFARGGAGADRS